MNRRGFTLIEFLIVVVMIGILAAAIAQGSLGLYSHHEKMQKRGYIALVKRFGEDGKPGQEWRVKEFMSRDGSTIQFLTTDSHVVTLNGNYVVEE